MLDEDTLRSQGFVPAPPPFTGASGNSGEATDTNLMPEKPTEEQKVPVKKEHKYRAVRGQGDPIFLIVEDKRHWILNSAVFGKLGYAFGEEETIPPAELNTYLPGETITIENVGKYV